MLPRTQAIFLRQDEYLPILAETFLITRKAEGKTAATVRYYQNHLRIFLAWCEAQAVTQVRDVTPDLLRRFLLAMAERHNAGGVHGIYRVVRAFLRFVEAEEVIPGWTSPTRKVKAPKVTLDPILGVTLEDAAAMLDTCDKTFTGARDRALILALLDTGARVSEFLAIDLADVDAAGAVLLKHTKGRRPRMVYLSQKTRRALRAYLRTRRDTSPALWTTVHGDRLTYDGLRGILTRRARLAGLNETPSPHDFRRAFALNYLRNGGDIFTLAKLLGHRGIDVLKRYLAQTDQDAKIAHAKFSPVDHLDR
ncbi:MAG: tyrosine-type recombinase/integrase [Chloroflexota bacterium]|jgi:site-specific recombinase XerD